MLFEKKMIILSGETGKGVVLIERNGLGVKFALRTFGVRGGLMAGIVAPDRVIVRDLPSTPDPSAVFYVDKIDLDSLHFAVFGTELVLYGAIGKRIWTSNLMDILTRHAAKPSGEAPVPLPPLKPIAEKPKTLPLPDGTGIPQTRLELYGDDAIAADNFYTGLDIDSATPRLDAFLSGARLLTDNPSHAPAERFGYSVGMSETTACAIDEADTEDEAQIETEQTERMGERAEMEINEVEPTETENGDPFAFTEAADENKWMTADNIKTETTAVRAGEGAGVSGGESTGKNLPWWKRQAEYIKNMSTREVAAAGIPSVKKSVPPASVKKIREVSFFERTKPDIDKLFSGAPRDTELSKLLDGEWVKVAFDGNAVSVGRLADSVICYAVAGGYEKTSPLGINAQWLPKTPAIPTGKGYWLIFQNLTTGEIIEQ